METTNIKNGKNTIHIKEQQYREMQKTQTQMENATNSRETL